MANIMLIDDDAELAGNTAAILEAKGGHTVNVHHSTEGAVQALLDARPDLLILDVMFPGKPSGGFDLARTIRHAPELRRLPIILLTAINQHFPMDFSPADIHEDWIPVQDFIEKPVDTEKLLATIDKLLATRDTMRGQVAI